MSKSSTMVDVAIVGAGIVGLATAYRIMERYPDTDVVLLEKESEPARHQTGRNSGVIHSGIYYEPGSLKAINCRRGKAALEDFCEHEDIPFERCGKVIVASNESEVPVLEDIYRRGQENGVTCERVDGERLRDHEPHVDGVRGIWVPESGIVNYRTVALRLVALIEDHGYEVRTSSAVQDIVVESDRVHLESTSGTVSAHLGINCAGLYADRIAEMGGLDLDFQIVPFRGEYYQLRPEAQKYCSSLIYPVPNPSFPFLGVHFTKTIDGGVECGPNAVLAFAREGYRKDTVDLSELAEILAFSGFRRLAVRYWQTGLHEMWRSFSKKAFTRALQKLVPAVRESDLEPAPAGVRAQALAPDGELIEDFVILENGPMVSVCNAPSPAATSSLNIGSQIVDRIEDRLG